MGSTREGSGDRVVAGWIRLDDDFPLNAKAMAAGKDARALHVAAICWSNRNLTDGRIPKRLAGAVAIEAGVKPGAVVACVAAGLWVEREDHFELHGYLERNRSKAQIEKERARWRKSKGIPPDSRSDSREESRVTPAKIPLARQVTLGSTNNNSIRLATLSPVDNCKDAVDAVLEAIVQHQVNVHRPKYPDRYAEKCRLSVCDEFAIDAERAVADFPGAPARSIAAMLLGESVPSLLAFRKDTA